MALNKLNIYVFYMKKHDHIFTYYFQFPKVYVLSEKQFYYKI